MQQTLFEIDGEPIKLVFRSAYQKWKYDNQYRKADYLSDIRCKNCIHRFIIHHHNKRYYKCELLGFSGSEATDIRLSNVCNNFEMIVKNT